MVCGKLCELWMASVAVAIILNGYLALSRPLTHRDFFWQTTTGDITAMCSRMSVYIVFLLTASTATFTMDRLGSKYALLLTCLGHIVIASGSYVLLHLKGLSLLTLILTTSASILLNIAMIIRVRGVREVTIGHE
jgi:hypothetical protein